VREARCRHSKKFMENSKKDMRKGVESLKTKETKTRDKVLGESKLGRFNHKKREN